ncbi:hypothetical protein CEUSTIGMA_g2846.t1 [Chlamydomonas eustigma]|uniref:Uncharacterized protein n=1 Tax=Chlamydomonas eustigma TaxID=1157962 RepID=A0A250WXQ3_9CHLO|nr:hypothetical protein CEUSTIGMA_g2846.t1 [Chlamydomonas eustigma]|eukprot:GAX75402.1 hypothetical protein CEUSTIGMA_g2846.t1 [Chlamydomonas eustigma]
MNVLKKPTGISSRLATNLPSTKHVAVRNGSSVQEQKFVPKSGGDEIYLGFPKGDYAPREGRKGRVIKDDPKKYPDKENRGFFIGATGGWAGGEAGLWKLRDEVKANGVQSAPSSSKAAAPQQMPASAESGAAPIYVGFDKDEIELRKSGAKGRVIYDDPTKYPGKDDVGVFAGMTGGFAGGERGLKAFVETGEVRIRKPGEPGGQPMSPLQIAFIVLIAGVAGSAVLTQVYNAGIAPV